MKRGKLIVVDGVDGVGKATQVDLLASHLAKDGLKTKTIDFPRYYDNFFGKLIGDCLAGKHGDFINVDPHIVSALYAADRWQSKPVIEQWLARGYTVIADRYASANQIHQGGKIHDAAARTRFLRWLDELEHKIFAIPRPNLIVYLDLPLKLIEALREKKRESESLAQKKRYLASGTDVAETNPAHLEDSRQSALKLVAENNSWLRIDCAPEGELLAKGEIHVAVLAAVRQKLGLTK